MSKGGENTSELKSEKTMVEKYRHAEAGEGKNIEEESTPHTEGRSVHNGIKPDTTRREYQLPPYAPPAFDIVPVPIPLLDKPIDKLIEVTARAAEATAEWSKVRVQNIRKRLVTIYQQGSKK